MSVQTIEELKEKWVNGYKPNENDLFDTIGNKNDGSGSSNENLILG